MGKFAVPCPPRKYSQGQAGLPAGRQEVLQSPQTPQPMDKSMGCGVIILMIPELGRIAGMLNLATTRRQRSWAKFAQLEPNIFHIWRHPAFRTTKGGSPQTIKPEYHSGFIVLKRSAPEKRTAAMRVISTAASSLQSSSPLLPSDRCTYRRRSMMRSIAQCTLLPVVLDRPALQLSVPADHRYAK